MPNVAFLSGLGLFILIFLHYITYENMSYTCSGEVVEVQLHEQRFKCLIAKSVQVNS